MRRAAPVSRYYCQHPTPYHHQPFLPPTLCQLHQQDALVVCSDGDAQERDDVGVPQARQAGALCEEALLRFVVRMGRRVLVDRMVLLTGQPGAIRSL